MGIKAEMNKFSKVSKTLDTRHPPPATRHPPPATHHPPPATRHPPPATRHPPPVEKTCRENGQYKMQTQTAECKPSTKCRLRKTVFFFRQKGSNVYLLSRKNLTMPMKILVLGNSPFLHCFFFRSSVGRVTVDLIRRSWVRFPPRSKDFFFPSCGSLIPFTRANAQWVIHGFS